MTVPLGQASTSSDKSDPYLRAVERRDKAKIKTMGPWSMADVQAKQQEIKQ